jgi:hypothetical protein
MWFLHALSNDRPSIHAKQPMLSGNSHRKLQRLFQNSCDRTKTGLEEPVSDRWFVGFVQHRVALSQKKKGAAAPF